MMTVLKRIANVDDTPYTWKKESGINFALNSCLCELHAVAFFSRRFLSLC